MRLIDMSEQDLVNAILDYLHLHGAWAIRVNSGGRAVEDKKGGKYFIRMAPAGSPDILAIWPGGLGMAIEAKMPGNKPTEIQTATLQQINECGGLAIVAWSIEDVENAIKERIKQCQK